MIWTVRQIKCGAAITGLVIAVLFSFTSATKAAGVALPKPATPISRLFAPATANGRVSDNALYGVSCITWTRCVAVGTRVAAGPAALRPLAEQWTGARWQVVPVPDPASLPRALLAKVSCQSRDNCMAVGYHYGPRGYAVLAEHWDGRRWRIVQSANPARMWSAFFNGVACQPRVGCIAVGGHSGRTGEGRALAERWADGHRRVLRVRWPAGALAAELNGISCDAGTCLAVGMYQAASGRVLTLADRWNGHSWTVLRPISARAPMSVLDDVSCDRATSCMAVGESQWTRQYPLAESWQNGRWDLVPGGKVPGGTLGGVSCQLRLWCMAVGAVGGKPLTEAWFGGRWRVTWTRTAGGGPAGALNQLSCRTFNGRCVTVGTRLEPGQSAGEATLAEWWGGKVWHIMKTRNP